jgi:hypothetical protein
MLFTGCDIRHSRVVARWLNAIDPLYSGDFPLELQLKRSVAGEVGRFCISGFDSKFAEVGLALFGERGFALQQFVASAPIFARLSREVDVRVEEYFSTLAHIAWFAVESHLLASFQYAFPDSVRKPNTRAV